MTLLDFQLVLCRRNIRSPHFASKVSYSASPQASAKCSRNGPCTAAPERGSVRRNPRRERPERAASPEPRATPWVSMHKRLRPVRAKVWANGRLLLLPLQGVGNGDMVPRALPWATDLLGFQPAQGRRQGFFRTISTYLISWILNTPTLQGRCLISFYRCLSASSRSISSSV